MHLTGGENRRETGWRVLDDLFQAAAIDDCKSRT